MEELEDLRLVERKYSTQTEETNGLSSAQDYYCATEESFVLVIAFLL